jgi:hypothetical protein
MIRSVATPGYKQVVIEASDGKRYQADLASFSNVHCFPKDVAEWEQVSIDAYGLALVWPGRFEVHVDQVVGLATSVEPIGARQAG